MEKIIKETLWSMSLSAVSYIGPVLKYLDKKTYNDLITLKSSSIPSDLLFGCDEKTKKAAFKRIDMMTNHLFPCHSRYDYYRIIQSLKKSDNEMIIQFNQFLLQAEMITKEGLSSLNKDKSQRNYATVLETCRRYRPLASPKSFYAYSLANAVALTRIAGFKGFLNDKEVIKELEDISLMVKEHFSSYFEFGQQATIAYNIHLKSMASYNYSHKLHSDRFRLSHAIYRDWKYLSWAGDCHEM